MGLWDDLEKFLEARLEQFLQANPQLQASVLLEQLNYEQEKTQATLVALRAEEEDLYRQILNTAEEIKKWIARKQQARQGGREDLAQAAAGREAELLLEGNQLWKRKIEVLALIKKNEELLAKIAPRRQELEAQVQQAKQEVPKKPPDNNELEAKFHQWEVDQALKELKRKMGL